MSDAEERKKKYEFKRKLEELKNNMGRGTELISLYIPPDRQIFDVVSYLRNEHSTSVNIKSKGTRKNVMSAIDSIMSRLKAYKNPPENGLVLFVGHIATRGDQTEMMAHIIEPIEPIKSFLYRCDSAFYLEPLEGMLGHKDVYGLIVVDRSEATIGFLKGTHIEAVKNIPSRVPSKHHQGGQSSRRFERLIEQAANDFFRKVSEKANEVFSDENIKGIFIGGPGATKEQFEQKEFLHHELRKKIVDLYDTGYTDESGLRELVDNAVKSIQDLDIAREKNLMQQFLVEVKAVNGGLAVYGEVEVRKALEMGAIDILLISEALRKYSIEFQCPECGGTKKVNATEGKIPEMICEKCNTEMEIKEKEDMIENFYELAESYSTKIELISEESEEGNLLLKAFGGIVGILRYRI